MNWIEKIYEDMFSNIDNKIKESIFFSMESGEGEFLGKKYHTFTDILHYETVDMMGNYTGNHKDKEIKYIIWDSYQYEWDTFFHMKHFLENFLKNYCVSVRHSL